jgi:menaquinol-cytochrome c reductase iron-sulfur subunit
MDTENNLYEESGMSRRTFFKWATGALTTVGALIIGVPFITSLIGTSSGTSEHHFVELVDIDALPIGQPKMINFSEYARDAFIVQPVTRDVWVVKNPDGKVTAFSPICPHLGCSYEWQPETGQFVCPCHGSIFDLNGKAVTGPSLRNLDTLEQKTVNGKLLIEYERFEVGIDQKKII